MNERFNLFLFLGGIFTKIVLLFGYCIFLGVLVNDAVLFRSFQTVDVFWFAKAAPCAFLDIFLGFTRFRVGFSPSLFFSNCLVLLFLRFLGHFGPYYFGEYVFFFFAKQI